MKLTISFEPKKGIRLHLQSEKIYFFPPPPRYTGQVEGPGYSDFVHIKSVLVQFADHVKGAEENVCADFADLTQQLRPHEILEAYKIVVAGHCPSVSFEGLVASPLCPVGEYRDGKFGGYYPPRANLKVVK